LYDSRAFEAEIRTYEGDDALEVWYRYEARVYSYFDTLVTVSKILPFSNKGTSCGCVKTSLLVVKIREPY
jgi:hypothetical protein